jgi:hypothetical protein
MFSCLSGTNVVLADGRQRCSRSNSKGRSAKLLQLLTDLALQQAGEWFAQPIYASR